MEEEQKDTQVEVQSNEQSEENPQRTKVSFPPVRRKQKAKKKLLMVVVLILILGALAAAYWFIFGEQELTLSPEEPTPTPLEERIIPTPTAKPVNKESIKIEVLNGTGIGGEAAFLQKELGELGYDDVDIGNADEKDYSTTEVTFARSISDEVREEIEGKLEDLYKDIKSKAGSVGGKDIQIIAGLRKGRSFPTKVPAATVTPEATTTLTPTPTATSSATPTP
jgi:hypothetical protein